MLAEANMLLEKHGSIGDIKRHGSSYIEHYGKETYLEIFRLAKELRKERLEEEEKRNPENAYSSKELLHMQVCLEIVSSADVRAVRQQAYDLKSRYRNMAGIFASCYPHQVNGRPARKYKNPATGITEWHAYKQLSFESVRNIYCTCVDFFNENNRRPQVCKHEEGEPVTRN